MHETLLADANSCWLVDDSLVRPECEQLPNNFPRVQESKNHDFPLEKTFPVVSSGYISRSVKASNIENDLPCKAELQSYRDRSHHCCVLPFPFITFSIIELLPRTSTAFTGLRHPVI
jgi:hypothetical protein